MPAAPSPSPPPPPMPSVAGRRAQHDVESLRHLVSHPRLAHLLLVGAPGAALRAAVRQEHKRNAILLKRVSRQALSTAVRSVRDIFATAPEHNPEGIPEPAAILDMVELVLELDDIDVPHPFQLSLFAATTHAALLTLLALSATESRQRFQKPYRRSLDLLRRSAWSSDAVSPGLKDFAISTIKNVVTAIYRFRKAPGSQLPTNSPRREADAFHAQFPIPMLRIQLQNHAQQVKASLSPLWHQKSRRGAQQATRSPAQSLREEVPDFFSDVEEVGDGDGCYNDAWQNRHVVKPEPSDCSPMHTDDSDVFSSENVQQHGDANEIVDVDEETTKRLSKKRRRSPADVRGQEQPGRRRSRPSPAPVEEHNGYRRKKPLHHKNASGAYKDGDDLDYEPPEDESVQLAIRDVEWNEVEELRARQTAPGVARQARGRGQRNREKRLARIQSRSPRVVGNRVTNGRDEHPSNKFAHGLEPGATESDLDEFERSRMSGEAGLALRGLHDASAHLKTSGIPDPLGASIRDARHAKRREKRSMHMRYSPGGNAQPASPIPGSETPIQRKQRPMLQLESDDEGSEEHQKGREVLFHGRILKTGRFQIYEDELLVEGLANHGWGMWTQIAKNFGVGKYTRAPMSLKDRARTMGLDPQKYPLPSSFVKRGRPSLRPVVQQAADAEKIESPGSSPNKSADKSE